MNIWAAIAVISLPFAGAGAYIGNDMYQEGRLPFLPSPIQKACQDAIALRLKSPSSMAIVTLDQAITPLGYEEAKARIERRYKSPSFLALKKAALHDLEIDWPAIQSGQKPRPALWSVSIEYDALNGFGVPLRRRERCEWLELDGKAPSGLDLDKQLVDVGGKNYFGWAVDSLNQP